jgi:hypothetical protein
VQREAETNENVVAAAKGVGGSGYNAAVAEPRRDDFPNNYIGDLMRGERGWVVVPPTGCPEGHAYGEPGWSVSSVWWTCNARHMPWRCWE